MECRDEAEELAKIDDAPFERAPAATGVVGIPLDEVDSIEVEEEDTVAGSDV